ncbi:hypothetical protein MMC18_003265 [Xylographa bjoerkii]|nr:hypothetical protein [Xylographa bjoerkii]
MSSTSSASPHSHPLISFYDPATAAPDAQGRTLTSILSWSDRKLEACHDYIQVLFPLPEASAFSYGAPVVDRTTFDAFRSRPALQAQLRAALARILVFYGFDLRDTDRGPEITCGADFAAASRNWVTRFDHNHLRITRILRSLRVLGLESEARAFFAALQAVGKACEGRISQKSMMFWTRAAERPLYLSPEDEGDEGEGLDFLYDYEDEKARRGRTGSHAEGGRGDGGGDHAPANGAGDNDVLKTDEHL